MTPNRLLPLVSSLLAIACGGTPSETAPASSAAPAAPAPAPSPAAPVEPAAAAQQPAPSLVDFAGEIALQWTSTTPAKPARSIAVQVKAGKLRFDVPEGVESARPLGTKARVVMDVTQKKLFVVAEEKRQVVLVELDDLQKQIEQFKAGMPGTKPEASTPPKVEKTGHADTVAGHRCEDWDVTAADGDKSRVCVAALSTSFFAAPTMTLPNEHAWARELFDGNHLPLRVVTFDATTGAERGRLEVTKIEARPLDDALFAVPADYKVVDLGAMLKGMATMMAAMAQPPGAGATTPGAGPPGGMPPNMQAIMQQMAAARAKAGTKGGAPPPDMNAMLEQMRARAKAAKDAKAAVPPDAK